MTLTLFKLTNVIDMIEIYLILYSYNTRYVNVHTMRIYKFRNKCMIISIHTFIIHE